MTPILRWPTLGIQARLVILGLVTVLPLVGLAGFAMIRTVDHERTRIERDAGERVAGLLADLDREITSIQAELRVLAVSPSLQTGDFASFDREMREALKVQGTSIVLHDTTGQQLLSTNRPFGELLPRATNTEMHDRVVATGKPQISDLIIGAVLRRPILTVGVPVFRDGRVAYVLAMGLGPEILTALLNEQNLPPDWNAGIFDRNYLIVAHNRGLDRIIGQPAMPELRARISRNLGGWFPSVTKDGIPYIRRSAAPSSAVGPCRSVCRENSSTHLCGERNGSPWAAALPRWRRAWHWLGGWPGEFAVRSRLSHNPPRR